MNLITNFTQIKAIIEPIPADKFITYRYGYAFNDIGCSCFLGHIHRVMNPENSCKNFDGDGNGYGARQLTEKFLQEHHGIFNKNGAHVNNDNDVNGYNEPGIKNRVMHMIEDAIKAGY